MSLLFRNPPQVTEGLFWRSAEEDLFSRREKGLEALPVIADNRRRTRSRFEKPDAGRIASLQHLGARDVQGEALPVVKTAMRSRRQVVHAFNICRPLDDLGVLRPYHDEASSLPM